MKKLSKVMYLCIVFITIIAAPISMAFTQPVTLRLHQFLPAQANVPKLVFDEWIRQIEEATHGNLNIEHHPSMQLGGKPAELYDQVKLGIVDIAWTVNGFTPGRFPRSEVFELPFIMTNAEATSRAYWDYCEKEMKTTDYKDVKILAAWVHGPGMLHTNRPIRKIEDMNGVRYRTPSPMVSQLLEQLGAIPYPMPVTEVPNALSIGVIDGAALPWEVTTSLQIAKRLHNHTEFADGYSFFTLTFTLAMNQRVYEKLPPDLRTAIDDLSGMKLSAFAGKIQEGADALSREIAVKAGNDIVTLSPEDSEKWKAVSQPVYDRWIAKMQSKNIDGKALLNEAQTLIMKYSQQ